MTSAEIRRKFLEFFKSKGHKIVQSAPIVIKNDPTLMFTNAGMNQFKEIFIGNIQPFTNRVVNSQKCLRVSGKHNDLEAVGRDGYHHTMFEMLGNWSFGDYFKEEAIDYAWEFLTEELGISKDRLYATIFEGDREDGIEKDVDSLRFWQKYMDDSHIITGSKKDNFWEMGTQGPCGPCSEIHIDLRDNFSRKQVSGKSLINKGDPLVIEIWNLVFIQYNRLADKSLYPLPQKHVDTGMGLERLTMIIQGKTSDYETDIFVPIIASIKKIAKKQNIQEKEEIIATHVISDHIRAIAFTIADGQLPSNTGAGYVIRRILRRAIRYGFTFLDFNKPFLYKLIPTLVDILGNNYPELKKQQLFIEKVIEEEETAFFRTLETGLRLLNDLIWEARKKNLKKISGKAAFELYDTYGFPADLTQLILQENNLLFDKKEFDKAMQQQRSRSKIATSIETDDWVLLKDNDQEEFIGYDKLEANVYITRYRKIKTKNKERFQLVFNITPFYAESGGQIGDTGYIINNEKERINIIDTQKEHNLIIHIADKLPRNLQTKFYAVVDKDRRFNIINNHSATHLLHYALRKIIGKHVEQRGSLVAPSHLRFDFSHFRKLTNEEILEIERMVNNLIRQNLPLEEMRNLPFDKAIEKGAIALFGEKYDDVVRVIKFGDSIELCGGTHVKATGHIGLFKITMETSVSSGIRRIEAVTGKVAEDLFHYEHSQLKQISYLLKSPKDLYAAIQKLITEKTEIEQKFNKFLEERNKQLIEKLYKVSEKINNTNIIIDKVDVAQINQLKQIAFNFRKQYSDFILVLAADINNKPNIVVAASDDIVKAAGFDASVFIREIAKTINGGGGGQVFLATAGGSNVEGIQNALNAAKERLKEILQQRN